MNIILTNLVSNALKFSDLSKKHPKIEIDIHENDGNIHIKVRDNGLGIQVDRLAKVFDMFYRAHKISDGSGIGLYIVSETVKKLKGEINIKSEINNFTEINVSLPNKHL